MKWFRLGLFILASMVLVSCGGNYTRLHVPGNADRIENVYNSVVAMVRVTNGHIDRTYCTAFFVTPRILTTAAHCVRAHRTIQIASGVTIVVPGRVSESSVGQTVHFMTYAQYNEWVQRSNEEEINPEFTMATVVVVDSEHSHDVALLELGADEPDAEYWLEMRNLENEPLRAGEEVYSIGMPLGQNWILTDGIISRVQIRSNATIDILHQVRIGPGSSGSPLLDHQARIVGINSSGWIGRGTGTVLGQAKPISYVQTLIRVLEAQRELDEQARQLQQLLE